MRTLLCALLAPVLLAQVDEGIQALDARQYDVAIQHFSKAIAADASDYGAHFNLGVAYSLSGKDALAVPEYRKTLELKPGTVQAEVNLALSLFNLQQFAEAAEASQRALAIDAKLGAAELTLGRSLASLKRVADADPHYRKAVALDAANREFLLELASVYEEEGQSAPAIAIYKEFPENPGAAERMGALQLRGGNAEEAIATLEAAVAKSPTPANHLALAQAYAKVNKADRAEPHAAEAVKASPADFELRMFYGQLLRDQRKFPLAAPQFQAAAQLKPGAAEAWTELASVDILLEQFPQALAALDRVRALKAEIPGHYFLRAMVQDRMLLRKEAIESYTRFLASSEGKNPDQEFQARQRVRTLEKDLGKR